MKCEWLGTVGTLRDHTATCKFAPLPCPNHCEERFILRQNMDEHLTKFCHNREYTCEFCEEKGTYALITQVHYEACLKRIIPCPFCKELMQRQQVKEHVAVDCKSTMVSCKFMKLGCNTALTRRDMVAHEMNDQHHLHMAIETTANLERDLSGALNRIGRLEDELKEKSDMLEQVQRDKEEVRRELGKRIGKLEQALKGATDRITKLDDSYLGVVRSLEEDKLCLVTTRDSILLVERKLATLKDGGPITFKLTHYRQKRENRIRFESPPFFTSSGSYRMCIRVDVRGESETHLSVYARFLEDENTKNLTWPFVGEVTFMLLNQLKDDNHHKRKLLIEPKNHVHAGGGKNDSYGYGKFVDNAKLEPNQSKSIQYLKDDTLYFRVSINVHNHKNWLECTAD